MDLPPPDLPELPDTVVEKTPREEGGYHYYFRVDEEQKSGKYNWNEDGVAYRCDFQADLVYVICSPSNFSGKYYSWLPGCSIFEREPAPLPPELVSFLEGKRKAKKSRKRIAAESREASNAKVRMEDLAWHEQLKYDEDAAIRIMQQCGAEVSAIGETFSCPLPEHGPDIHPSASLVRSNSGEIIFRDWHNLDEHEWYSLANVYALCSSRKQGLYFYSDDVIWHDRWWARALYESGCSNRPLPTLAMKQELLPAGTEDVPDSAEIVYEAVCYITQLEEWLYGKRPGESGKVIEFPSRFATTWRSLDKPTCMSASTYTGGLKWHREHSYLDVRDMDKMCATVLSGHARRKTGSRRTRTYVQLTQPD